ncbi:MAG: chorismate mutase [Desulfobacteraceae bacterium]|nr:chorismate mutase [Desulfobacteraceae bacterium]
MKKILLVCLLSLFSLQARADVTTSKLFKTMNERLSYMEDVALFKAQNHLPIEDIQRENIVLGKAEASAGELGFDIESVKDFFNAQIAVAKAIQYRCRADLLSRPSSRRPLDLKKDVRPALIRLGDQLIVQMAAYCKSHGKYHPEQFDEFSKAITVKYVTKADKQLLFNALLKVKLR